MQASSSVSTNQACIVHGPWRLLLPPQPLPPIKGEAGVVDVLESYSESEDLFTRDFLYIASSFSTLVLSLATNVSILSFASSSSIVRISSVK